MDQNSANGFTPLAPSSRARRSLRSVMTFSPERLGAARRARLIRRQDQHHQLYRPYRLMGWSGECTQQTHNK